MPSGVWGGRRGSGGGLIREEGGCRKEGRDVGRRREGRGGGWSEGRRKGERGRG